MSPPDEDPSAMTIAALIDEIERHDPRVLSSVRRFLAGVVGMLRRRARLRGTGGAGSGT